jgi:hypothetical protein
MNQNISFRNEKSKVKDWYKPPNSFKCKNKNTFKYINKNGEIVCIGQNINT